jgi:hypothetical protein
MTSGRESNLIGAALSEGTEISAAPALGGAGLLERVGCATWLAWAAAGFAVGALGAGFCGFTGTFDVVGFGLGGGRVAFLATAVLRTAFLGIAFPGFLAALFGFFEGI